MTIFLWPKRILRHRSARSACAETLAELVEPQIEPRSATHSAVVSKLIKVARALKNKFSCS